MQLYLSLLLFSATLSVTFGYAEYIPKSYYLIDRFGHKSDVYLLRNKRELMPLLRNRRFASSGSQSGSASFASSGAGSSDDIHFQIPDFTAMFAGAGFPPGFQDAARRAFHNSGYAGSPNGEHISVGPDPPGPQLLSRFGEGVGGDVAASSKAAGQRGSFSSSSTSVDSDGNVKYKVEAGKY